MSVFPAAFAISVAAHAQAQSAAPASVSAPAASVPATPRGDRALGEGSSAPSPAAAQAHFERALTWYRAGKYRLAQQELNAALASDPVGKDLVFNLALVQEKLGDLAGAIHSLERFQSMEKDPRELERAAQTMERLQGARAEQLALRSPAVVPAPPPPACPEPRPRGKFDAWVVGTGGFSMVSFVLGSVFALRALALDDRSQATSARDSALIADLAFATSLLAGAGTVALYFGRYGDSLPSRAPASLPRFTAARLEIRY